MPRKPEELREPAEGQVKSTRRRGAFTSPNVTEAKPPASVGATLVDDAAPATTLPVTETPHGAEEEIRRRAYELYEQDGRPHGRHHDHWLRAEAEILSRATQAHIDPARANDARLQEGRGNERTPRRGQKSA